MITTKGTGPRPDDDIESTPERVVRDMLGRLSRLELAVGALIGAVMLVLVLIEPEILEAPFENARTLLFTFGGTVLAGLALVAMLWFRVPPVVRVVVLVVPFAVVNWWLLSPYFIDDVVDEAFSTSIADQLETADADASPSTSAPDPDDDETGTHSAESGEGAMADEQSGSASTDEEPAPEPVASGPVLLGAGEFVGLAGHSGTGDAGIFENPDQTLLLRFENFDIDNGPDLEVYLVPGADQTSLAEGSIHLGALEGNVGDQTYEFPDGTELAPGEYTALVWCEAFSVEFVGATISI